MSDFEDAMDIDPPASSIKFSAESSKGKRITAANLPVEAEDTLPW